MITYKVGHKFKTTPRHIQLIEKLLPSDFTESSLFLVSLSNTVKLIVKWKKMLTP